MKYSKSNKFRKDRNPEPITDFYRLTPFGYKTNIILNNCPRSGIKREKMKFKEFKTAKGEFVLIDMKDVDYDILGINGDRLEKIGFISDITEEQASEVTEEAFNAYNERTYKYYGDDTISGAVTITALESLNSLFESIGVLWVNTHEKPGEEMFYKRKSESVSWGDYLTEEYNKAEQNVFDKSRTYLFRKV